MLGFLVNGCMHACWFKQQRYDNPCFHGPVGGEHTNLGFLVIPCQLPQKGKRVVVPASIRLMQSFSRTFCLFSLEREIIVWGCNLSLTQTCDWFANTNFSLSLSFRSRTNNTKKKAQYSTELSIQAITRGDEFLVAVVYLVGLSCLSGRILVQVYRRLRSEDECVESMV